MSKLRQMAIFAHIVECGSISAAAEKLMLSKSVVSQHLKSLEKELCVTLLKRTTRKQQLTSVGAQFYEQCRMLNLIADQAWQEAQHQQQYPRGNIKVTAPQALMAAVVIPAISALLKDYPQVSVELIAADKHIDLFAENIDLAIRVGESKDSQIKQRCIGGFRDVLCATREYRDNTAQMHYVANHWQGTSSVISHVLASSTEAATRELQFPVICQADSFHSCLALIQQHAGVGLLPDFIVKQHPDLVPVLSGYQLDMNRVYALKPFTGQAPLSVTKALAYIEKYMQTIAL